MEQPLGTQTCIQISRDYPAHFPALLVALHVLKNCLKYFLIEASCFSVILHSKHYLYTSDMRYICQVCKLERCHSCRKEKDTHFWT